jgi:hypothetical protein
MTRAMPRRSSHHVIAVSGVRLLHALIFGAALFFTAKGQSQVLVDLSIKRVMYIAYEPLLATVRITNLSGNPLLLADVEGKKWFGFQIDTLDGRPIPPSNPDYEIDPIKVGPGESITRTINLVQLYPITDFGSYKIRASVYSAELSNYFSSPPLTVEITEGRLLWQQTVGVPAIAGLKGGDRTISLLTHRLSERTDLYLRIEDKQAGIVYCTHRLGDFISYSKPDIKLDTSNIIHVIQNNVPHEFIYTKVGLDGKILDQLSYSAPKTRPELKRLDDGTIAVAGGTLFDPKATPTPGVTTKLSDRPVPLPTPEVPTPTPQKGKKKKPDPLPTPAPVKVNYLNGVWLNKPTTPTPTSPPVHVD